VATPAGQFHPWRLITTFLVILIGLYALVFFTPGSRTPKLGIDLQGGTRITLKARTADGSVPSRDAMNQARDIMERRVNGSGVAGAQVQVDGADQLVITVPGQDDNLSNLTRSAQLNIRPVVSAWTSPDLAAAATSGATATGTAAGTATGTATSQPSATAAPAGSGAATGSATGTAAATGTATSGASQGLRRDANALATTPTQTTTPAPATTSATATTGTGTAGATTTGNPATTGGTAAPQTTQAPPLSAFPPGSDPKVPIQPAAKDATGWADWMTAAEAYSTSGGGPTCSQIQYYAGLDDPNRPLLACDTNGTTVYLLDKTLVPGTEISDATSGFDTQNGQGWVVNVAFKSSGFATWSSYTVDNVGKQTAFTLDGEVLSAPTIQEAITTTTTQVSGSFNQQSAKDLANSLKFGALPLSFEPQEAEQVSAELGYQYLQAGLIAGGIGLILVVLYCLLYYRLLGVITILSLVLSGSLIYAVMVLLGRWIGLSLDMAGIAGLIIAIGITADSFVVYFERIKDEVREGRTFRSAVPRGWPRARRTILSADAVSFLSAAILYVLAVGDVKGFAFTLGLSTVLDLVIVFLVTHPLVALASNWKIFGSPVMSGLGKVAQAGSEHRAATARLAAKEA
jgi:preprotein translocase subunit SecD